MTQRQLDLYSECNLGQAPEEMFREQCCVKCVNPECSRSMYGKTRFQDRVENWYGRMFENVPRMIPDDPRYGAIAGQKFLLIEPAKAGAQSDWMDPRDLESTVVQVPREVPPPVEPDPIAVTPDPIAPVERKTAPVESKTVMSGVINTPVKKGLMITPSQPPKPAAGEWVTPTTPPLPDVQVVKSGAKIKLGGT